MVVMPERRLRRVAPLAVMLAAMLSSVGAKPAEATEPSPFGKSAPLADARLASLRGGFDLGGSVTVPFGIELDFAQQVNGVNTASFAITNHGIPGPVQITEQNVNMTIPIAPATTVTTNLTSSGIRTTIQNAQSNIALQTSQRLNAILSGLPAGGPGVHNFGNLRSIFH
jgi:hypothetical protein